MKERSMMVHGNNTRAAYSIKKEEKKGILFVVIRIEQFNGDDIRTKHK